MCQVLNISEFWKVVNFSQYVRVLDIHKFSLIWQGFEYASGSNYGRVLNIPGFWVRQASAYVSVAQASEYGWIMPYGRVLNVPVPRFIGF